MTNKDPFAEYAKLRSEEYMLIGINGIFDTQDARRLFEDIADFAMRQAADSQEKEMLFREMKPQPDDDITLLIFWRGTIFESSIMLLNKSEPDRVTHWATPESMSAFRAKLLEAFQ